MCFVPACFEIAGMILLAPRLLGISILEAAVMGTVIAAVSPAVIVLFTAFSGLLAVMSILITAPLGAFLIDGSYKILLERYQEETEK